MGLERLVACEVVELGLEDAGPLARFLVLGRVQEGARLLDALDLEQEEDGCSSGPPATRTERELVVRVIAEAREVGDQSAVTASEELRAGYWVKRVDPATKNAEPFFHTRPEALGPRGLEYVATAGPKRLVDLAFSPDGEALYVVDIGPIQYVKGAKGPEPRAFPGTGVVWRISRKDT